MKYNSIKLITKDYILNRVTEEDIYKHYTNIEPDIKERYCNPLREDEQAGCKFYVSKNTGKLKFVDYSHRKEYDCFDIVQEMYDLSFKQALIHIGVNMKIINIPPNERLSVKHIVNKNKVNRYNVNIIVDVRNYTQKDYNFWMQFNINKLVLRTFNVYPINNAWLDYTDREQLIYTNDIKNPGYCYYFGDKNYKLYFPFTKSNKLRKFYHVNTNILQGYKQLPITGKYVVITKSMKDVMSMYSLGIAACAPMSENIFIRDVYINALKQRFDYVFSLMDRDYTGVKMAQHLKKTYDIQPLMFTTQDEKDFSDNIKKYGYQYMINYVEDTKKQLFL